MRRAPRLSWTPRHRSRGGSWPLPRSRPPTTSRCRITQCDPDVDENCAPPGICIPTDYNGDEPGCGEPPANECPPGEEDHNGDFPGCGEPPAEECPDGDHNGDEPGCGTPPVEECPPGQDHNGELPGCGEAPGDGGGDNGGDNGGGDNGGGNGGNNGGGNGNGNGNGNSGNNGGGGGGGTEAGGGTSSGGASPEGSVPSSASAGVLGTTACGDSSICSNVVAPVAAAGPAAETLPDTGAPVAMQQFALLGFGLLAGGGTLIRRTRRLPQHRA